MRTWGGGVRNRRLESISHDKFMIHSLERQGLGVGMGGAHVTYRGEGKCI